MNIHEKCYLLAGKHGFIHRFCDTGFKTKWSGLWSGTKKYLDYFAFKVNDEWLSPETCTAFEEDGATATHFFPIKNLEVEEKIFIAEEYPALVCQLRLKNKLSAELPVCISLEVGVDIRSIEGSNSRQYMKKFEEGKIFVASGESVIAFGSSLGGREVFEPYYKEHYPGGEKQVCFVPGLYQTSLTLNPLSTQTVDFIFVFGSAEKDFKFAFNKLLSVDEALAKKYELYGVYEDLLKNSPVDRLFRTAAVNMEKCTMNSAFIAGYPWYTNVWGRDAAWMSIAATDLGNFEYAKSCLEFLYRWQSKEGIIPNFVSSVANYNSADATPLWLIALNRYVEGSGDLEFIKSVEGCMLKSIAWYWRNADENGFVSNGSKETWMDTLDRKGICLDVCSLWCEALRSSANLLKLLGKDNKEILQQHKKLKSNIEKFFWQDGFYVDNLEAGERSINAVFPLVFGISKKPVSALKVLESSEFTTIYGASTISRYSPNYRPDGYHTGSCWGKTLGLLAAAEFLNSRIEKGLQYLKILESMSDTYCINALPEAWNVETGSLMLLKPSGYEQAAFLQGWSAATAIICIDEYMLGIKPNAFTNSVYLSPSISDGMAVRRKRIGKDLVELFIGREGGSINLHYNSVAGKKYKLIPVPIL